MTPLLASVASNDFFEGFMTPLLASVASKDFFEGFMTPLLASVASNDFFEGFMTLFLRSQRANFLVLIKLARRWCKNFGFEKLTKKFNYTIIGSILTNMTNLSK